MRIVMNIEHKKHSSKKCSNCRNIRGDRQEFGVADLFQSLFLIVCVNTPSIGSRLA